MVITITNNILRIKNNTKVMCCFNFYITVEMLKFLFLFIDSIDVDNNGTIKSDDQQKMSEEGKIFISNSNNIF